MAFWTKLRDKHFSRWLPGYAKHVARATALPLSRPAPSHRHLVFAVCDHFEPLWGNADDRTGNERVKTWHEGYPEMASEFRDADGKPPQHSFFFPGEEYRDSFFDMIDDLVRDGFGEVELHLHHEDQTEVELRADIERYLDVFGARGHFARERGKIRYGFIHGDWALANARPDGKNCGVDAELPLLFDTGCYADFTFPSLPDVSQPNTVNQIYWPMGDLSRRRSYEGGREAEVGLTFADRILMVTGPVGVGRRARSPWVRLEYGALTAADPPTRSRVASWVRQNIHIVGRPEWVFVKVYTHGAPESQASSLLGDGMRQMHRALTSEFNRGNWTLHYVTAREMFNIAMAAMDDQHGDPNDYRDYRLAPPPILGDARG